MFRDNFKKFEPVFTKAASLVDSAKMKVGKYDATINHKVADKYKVLASPNFVLFR